MYSFFFFNDTATTEIYTLSLHDALPIWPGGRAVYLPLVPTGCQEWPSLIVGAGVRRSEEHTSNSSHLVISYAVFCLKKKENDIVCHLLLEIQKAAFLVSAHATHLHAFMP